MLKENQFPALRINTVIRAITEKSVIMRNQSLARFAWDLALIARSHISDREFDREKICAISEIEKEEAEVLLARHGFSPNWVLSYEYEGEDASLVRFWYDPERYPEYPYRQTHVRIFSDEFPDGYIGMDAHTEPNALVHRRAHVKMNQVDRTEGFTVVSDLFEAHDVEVVQDE